MFSRRRALSKSRKYSREFFRSLISDLREAGFANLNVLLPHNLVGVDSQRITPEELLTRERNYPSLILEARAEEKNETLKILFVNTDAKTYFMDDTFPSGQSTPPELYFQSPDPGRAYAVFEFFYDRLCAPSLFQYLVVSVSALLLGLAAITEVITVFDAKAGFISHRWGRSASWDVAVLIVTPFVLIRYFKEPTGLWIKPSREPSLFRFLKMALRGDFKDNPVTSLVLGVLGTVLATIVLKLLKVL